MIRIIKNIRSLLKTPRASIFSYVFSIIYLSLSLGFMSLIGHRWNAGNTDADYIHLFNTLNVIEGYPQGNIDNPATTLHLISSVVFSIVFFLRNNTGQMNDKLVVDVIKNPDIYINTCSIFFIISISILLFFFSRKLLTRQNGKENLFALGTLLLITPFFSNPSKFSAQPLLIISAIILLGTVFRVQFLKEEANNKLAIVVGFCLALGIFSKFTFVHLSPIVFFLGFNKKHYLFFFSSFIFFSCLFGFRLFGEEQRVYLWIKRNMLHSGDYGSNPNFLPNLKAYFDNILFFLKGNVIFSLVLSSVVILFSFNPKYFKTYPLVAIIALCEIIFILFMAKHRTSSYYFIADFIFIPVFAKFIYDTGMKKNAISKYQLPSLVKIIAIISIVIFFLTLVNLRVKKFKTNLIDNENFFVQIKEKGVLNGTGAGTMSAASYIGNIHSGYCYTTVLKEIFGNQTFFEIYTENMVDFGGKEINKLKIGDKILLNKYYFAVLNKVKYQIIEDGNKYMIICKVKD